MTIQTLKDSFDYKFYQSRGCKIVGALETPGGIRYYNFEVTQDDIEACSAATQAWAHEKNKVSDPFEGLTQ